MIKINKKLYVFIIFKMFNCCIFSCVNKYICILCVGDICLLRILW